MHKFVVIAFGFVCALMDFSMGAKADAKRYAIIMDALGLHDEFVPQLLGDLEEFLSGPAGFR